MTYFSGEVKGEASMTFLLLLFSHIPSVESIQYVKVPYFGVVRSEPHQYFNFVNPKEVPSKGLLIF